ncbi:MAG: CAP domain-containing protein [Ignavibacteria bacterium]|nr:CAP domain-containing protein [Ignavibacteria bacterium]
MRIFSATILLILLNLSLYSQDLPLVSISEIYDQAPDVSNCNEGKLKDSEKQKATQYLNYIRSLHNLKPVQYASQYDKETAKSALISVANGLLDHFPKTSYHCYTQDGYTGCVTSNLYLGSNFSPNNVVNTEKGIQSWIIDQNIEDLGHRRNLLNPFLKYTSFGRVDGYSKANSSWFLTGMSIKVHQYPDYHNLSDWTSDFVAYPYNDYPSSYFDASWYLSFTVVADKSNIWNNDNKKVDFSAATVKVTNPSGNELSISNLKYDYLGYGVPNCIYWKTSGLQKDVKYTVTISNVKVNGTPKTFTYWFRITDNPPTAGIQPPTPLSPPDNSTDVEIPVNLTWSNVSNAQYYALQVSTNSDFTNLLVDLKNITSNSYKLTSLNDNTKYFWRVATIKDNQMSNWSSTFSFTTKAFQLSAPIVFAPQDGEVSIDLKPTFKWSKVPGAEKYHLQTCLDNSFDDFALIINKEDITDTVYTSTTKFFPKTIYYWRVRALKGSSASSWSQVRTFWTLDPSFVEEKDVNKHNYFIIDDTRKATILLDEIKNIVGVYLCNIYGEKISLQNEIFEENLINIPYHRVSSGLWILEIITKKEIHNIYLLILK